VSPLDTARGSFGLFVAGAYTAKDTVVDLSRDVSAETECEIVICNFLVLFGTYDLNFVVVISLVAGYPYQGYSNWYILVTSLDCGLNDMLHGFLTLVSASAPRVTFTTAAKRREEGRRTLIHGMVGQKGYGIAFDVSCFEICYEITPFRRVFELHCF
jgi:hypothetical protein